MKPSTLTQFLQCLRVRMSRAELAQDDDRQLLDKFSGQDDRDAFSVLLARHGPMVWGVCRRVLGSEHEAEDAFAATFLVLIKKAGSLRKKESLAGWLHGVAYRVALKAGSRLAQRQHVERNSIRQEERPAMDAVTWNELRVVLDEEIERLPSKLRMPLVLCCLQEKTHAEAAAELAWPRSSVTARLTQAKEMLCKRLIRRGVEISPVLLAGMLAESTAKAALPAGLMVATARLATLWAAGETAAAGGISAGAITLAKETLKGMLAMKVKFVLMTMALGLAVAGVGVAGYQAARDLAEPDADQAANRKLLIEPNPPAKLQPGKKDPLPAKDLYGDPLPEGALARLGSVRWLHDGSVRFASFLPDGKRLVTTGDDLTIRVWDFASGKEISRPKLPLPAPGGLYSTPRAALSKDGKTIATYWGGEELYFHDINTGKELKRLKIEAKGETPKGGRVFALALSPAGDQLACLQNDGTLQLWDWAKAKQLHNFGPPLAKLQTDDFSLAYAPDGKSLAVAYLQYEVENKDWTLHTTLKIYNTATGAELFPPVHSTAKDWNSPLYVGFSPDGKTLAFTKDDNITFVETASGKVIGKLGDKPLYAGCFVFGKDGTRLYADSGKGVGEWEVATGKLLRECGCSAGIDTRLSLSPDERTLVLTGGPQTPLARLTPPKAGYEMWATSGGDHSPQFFDLSGKEIAALNGPSGPVVGLQFLPDGKNLLTQRVSGFRPGPVQSLHKIESVQKWDAGSGKLLDTSNRTSGFFRSGVGVSRNGKFLAGFKRISAGEGKPPVQNLVMIDAASGKELGQMPLKLTERLPSGANIQVSVSISPDGKTVAIASFGAGKIELYEFPGGGLRQTLEVMDWKGTQTRHLFTAVFSLDGKTLASLVDWNTVGLWDVTTGQHRGLIQSPISHPRSIKGAAFSPDGRNVGLALEDGTAALIELATGQVRSRFGKSQDPPKVPKEGPFLVPKDIPCVAFSPDGKSLAQVGKDPVVRLWDILTGRELDAFKGHTDAIYAVAFAHDGRKLASGGEDGTALIWDVAKVKRPSLPDKALQAANLEKHWQALAESDAAKAWAAIGDLVAAPKQTVAFIKENLKPATPPDMKHVEELIRQLDDAKPNVRDKANSDLLKFGEQIIPALDKALAANLPLEPKRRLENLRGNFTGMILKGERLRAYRAIEVLELINTPEARQVLQILANGAPEALLTTSAQAALKRL